MSKELMLMLKKQAVEENRSFASHCSYLLEKAVAEN